MKKAEFLSKLKDGLSCFPDEDAAERLTFYEEMIDDKTEEGMSEEQAVSELGEIDGIISQIVSDIPLGRIVKEKIKPKRTLNAPEIVLIVLGFPLWFPLICAAAAVLLSLYISAWAVIISLWAVQISFLICFIGALCGAVICFTQNKIITAAAFISAGLLFAGLTIFMFYGCLCIGKGLILLTKKSVIKLKTKLINRGDKK